MCECEINISTIKKRGGVRGKEEKTSPGQFMGKEGKVTKKKRLSREIRKKVGEQSFPRPLSYFLFSFFFFVCLFV